ncbi:hydrogen peroxide-inducible genes activator [Pelagibacterium limicola]|uniref:hydrogen peroxide-inducible genes activator n=1 Tax=Pelagibacterium limicola TaxID=2791022 RepID=UPI0018AF8AF7|nr:hydrogen peroxide-inducible genes activator [Pelagibacterium limicola]
MLTISFRQLQYAQIIAEEAHFGRAATRCHVTQPALSQQIKLLEDRCGAPIFDRQGKSIRVTPFGRDFLAHASRVLSAAQDLESFVDMAAGHPARPLRFGLIPTVAPYLLPGILPALTAGVPETRFSVSEGKTDRLLDGLSEGELDLALLGTPPPSSSFETATLFSDPFVLAAPSDSDLLDPIDLASLPDSRFLLLEEGHCLRDQMLDACALSTQTRGRRFAATSLTTILELVAAGYGVTLLPAISLRREMDDQRIRFLQLAPPGASRVLRLVWRTGSPYQALFRSIAEIVWETGTRLLASELPS